MTLPPPVLAVAGVLLIGLANYDALVTTIAVGSGVRPLTMRVAQLQRLILRKNRRLLAAGGPIILLTSVSVWIVLLWAGYSLLFASDVDGITATASDLPSGFVARIYYAGYTLFTLGNGGFQPASSLWQIVTNIATLNGLFITTLAITYLVPVVSAVVERRQMAAMITSLGTTAEEVMTAAWNGADFSYLDRQLPGIAQQIMLTAERHIAYPVLHDFRSRDVNTASERTLAMVDDVLTLLEHGVDPSVRIEPATIGVARSAIAHARQLMPVGLENGDAPPLPNLEILAAQGIPTRTVAQFTLGASGLADHRCRLAALVKGGRWEWPNAVAAAR